MKAEPLSDFITSGARAPERVSAAHLGWSGPLPGAPGGHQLHAAGQATDRQHLAVQAVYGRWRVGCSPSPRPPSEATILDNRVLEARRAVEFFSFPQGIVAVGEGTIGLIEASS
jgi:hypothetical protein